MSTYYDILKVKTNASQAEIKTAYKRMAFIHHPDRNGGKRDSEESFKNIYEAYKTLSNSTKRKLYDDKKHIYKSSDLKYNYHQGGLYSSLNNIKKSPSSFQKNNGYVRKKRDIDYYLFWATTSIILVLILVLVLKF